MKLDYPDDSEAPAAGAIALIIAAEKLFAEHGIAGVSLRQVTEAAGARNASAIQYHFGSRAGLVMAILNYRMARVDGRRQALFQTLEEQQRLPDLRAVVGAIVYPLADEFRLQRGPSYYLRFLERVFRERTITDEAAFSGEHGWKRSRILLRSLLDYLPPAVADLRVGLVWEQAITGLASIEARLDASGGEGLLIQVENLIDVLAGGIIAPVSPEALQAFRHIAG